MGKKVILIIMDGWGLGKIKSADAIQHANTPFVNSLYKNYPHTTLQACGESVGLPEGQMGNSEVGHLNIGAGRIVYQELQRINVAIKNQELSQNSILLNSINYAKQNNKPLHLLGLVSDGGVHSHIHHLKALCSICKENGLENVFIHAFTDGRDTDPKSGLRFIKELEEHLNNSVGKIATITGRYFAMDRDKRWERVKKAYHAMVKGVGVKSKNSIEGIENSYNKNITDEFIEPIIIVDENNNPLTTIQEEDAVLCFNFRTDRCREITQVLSQQNFEEYEMNKMNLHFTTMTEYDKTFKNIHTVFDNENVKNTLGEVLEKNNKSQIRIAETEKYPHVTFFFSGGREEPFKNEKRILAASPKVATYDLKPEMSAIELTDLLLPEIENKSADFICLNYANADMVGHTGVWNAVIKAVETVDSCVNKVVSTALENDYTILVTADHGNADYLINEDGTPNTAHSLNLVPFIVVDKNWKPNLKSGILADIAPTILSILNIKTPLEMKGNFLTSN